MRCFEAVVRKTPSVGQRYLFVTFTFAVGVGEGNSNRAHD
jgi:hypothetical protein